MIPILLFREFSILAAMDACLTPARRGAGGQGMPQTPVPAAIVTAEVNRLRDELDGMYATLQAKDEVLTMSANYGKALVEQNAELEQRLATSVALPRTPCTHHTPRSRIGNSSIVLLLASPPSSPWVTSVLWVFCQFRSQTFRNIFLALRQKMKTTQEENSNCGPRHALL